MNTIYFPAQAKYIESFRKKSDDLISELENYASEHKVPILSWQAAELMEQLILMKNPKRVLELGTAIGYTTIRIARVLGKKSEIHTIEMSVDNITVAKDNFEKSGLAKKIKLYEGNALTILPQLQKKYDFIFLDADKVDYKRLFDYSMILLKRSGVIVIDNLLWHGYAATSRIPTKYKNSTNLIRDFNRIFTSQENLLTTILPVGDGIGIGIKK